MRSIYVLVRPNEKIGSAGATSEKVWSPDVMHFKCVHNTLCCVIYVYDVLYCITETGFMESVISNSNSYVLSDKQTITGATIFFINVFVLVIATALYFKIRILINDNNYLSHLTSIHIKCA